MLFYNAEGICQRHMLVIADLSQKAEKGELVGDLVRATVRKCAIEMQAAGAETSEIREIFARILPDLLAQVGQEELKRKRVLEEVENHVDFLLSLEEKHEQRNQTKRDQ